MSKSAGLCGRRTPRQREICERALRLVIEHGYDGFTMEDLAHAVGISRRTLFNHVTDKASAVLGMDDLDDHADVQTFVAGGPNQDIAGDTLWLVETLLADVEECEPDLVARHQLLESAIAADPKLRRVAEARFSRLTDDIVTILCTREGWPEGDLRARALGTTLLGLVYLSLQLVAEGSQTSLLAAFRSVRWALLALEHKHLPSTTP